jgi:hypothetical protein
MTGNSQSTGSSLLRAGLLSGLIMAAGAILIWMAVIKPNQAGAAPESMQPAAYLKTKDKLLISIGLANPEAKKLAGKLQVELVGPDGKVLERQDQKVEQSEEASAYRFEFGVPKMPLDKVTLKFQYGNEKPMEVPVSDIIVAKAHETSVSAGQEFHSGSLATLRCGVHGVKSISETIPLAGAEVEVRLKPAKGDERTLYKGKADGKGIANAQFKMPDVPAGQYTLVVATKSELGEEKLEQPIKVKAEAKILLVTDKPLYQPGQEIHIRALALRPFDLTPEASSNLVFEIEDAKGNKVFKKAEKTSEYGIAAVDFQLADEVNMGQYQIRAILGNQTAQKSVDVKKYVLPKFKVEVKADKKFYMPKETIQLEVQSDYFFGKPVAQGKIKVTASTFDVQFRQFKELNGTTDANGHAKFEIQLPDYFVGQPLQKGDAIVKLEVKLTDTADHAETMTKTYPVSDKAIRVSLIPEAGRLVPGMENRVFAAAIYPDGSPAQCDVQLWIGSKPADGKPFASVKTNDAGLAEFRITPKAEQFQPGQWEQRNIEMLGGQVIQTGGQQLLFPMSAKATDPKGSTAIAVVTLNGEPLGDNVLLRLDKAIYKGGDTLNAEIRTSAGMPTAYLDIVRGGQTMLTRWLDVKDGKATHQLDLPANIFGTLEVHAYQMLASGEIIRDSRVVYVHPKDDLKLDIKADKDVYLPGAEGKITFQVTDSAGKPTPAALGVIIVDEAVYALQDMQPGLEKVYFTLQEELLKPQAQVIFKPSDTIDTLVLQPRLADSKQQIAQALLANVRPKPPARWEVAPAHQRKQQVEGQVQQIGWALYNWASQDKPFMEYDKAAQRWKFKADLLKEAAQARQLDAAVLLDPFGNKLGLDELAKMEKNFTPDQLAGSLTMQRMQQLQWTLINHANQNRQKFLKSDQWELPESFLADAAKAQKLDARWLKDSWGNPIRLEKRKEKPARPSGQPVLDQYELVSAGPDGKLGTADDVKAWPLGDQRWNWVGWWWLNDPSSAEARQQNMAWANRRVFMLQNRAMKGEGRGRFAADALMERAAVPMAAPAGAGFAGGFPAPKEAAKAADFKNGGPAQDKPGGGGGQGGSAPVTRVREYFPETLLWQPALITDDKGVFIMPLKFADSITTWRLSASANSRGGSLGGVTAPLRVFQDFFVDLDLPVSLTQNDEVAFPVAVYNYLKTPQTVKIDLQQESWFELLDSEGLSRSLDLKPNEVTSIKYRIKAKKVGFQPLTVKAQGTKMSDAIKRSVEIVPDGQKVEQVVTDRLSGPVKLPITIPQHAVPDASKIIVKVYPGVMAQVLEGTEGMLRLPGG